MVSSSSSSSKADTKKNTMFSSSSSSSSKARTKKNTVFQRRQHTVMKKAYELSTLCDIQVAVICYGPNGDLHTWPEDVSKVREIAKNYKANEMGKPRKSLTVEEFIGKTKTDGQNKRRRVDIDADRLDGSSAEELTKFLGVLDAKLETLQERLRFLDNQKRSSKGSSDTSRDRCGHLSSNQQIVDPPLLSDSAQSDLSLVRFEPQMAGSEYLQGCSLPSTDISDQRFASIDSVDYACTTSSSGTNYQNLSANNANGDRSYCSEFPTIGQINSYDDDDLIMIIGGDYSNYFAPPAYGESLFHTANDALMMNNYGIIDQQFPFPQTTSRVKDRFLKDYFGYI